MTMPPLRIGVLGAARIAPFAIISPAREIEGVTVTGIAARDEARAKAFAAKHGIAKAYGSYEAMIEDPSIDAIYNPLPNSHHASWTIRALEAGKHVLCEKPLTANAQEAVLVAEASKRTGRVCMEAFHWRYHPFAARMIAIAQSGELGKVERIETSMCIPLPLFDDIRYDLALAGGASMDTGCYAVSMLRHIAGTEPTVTKATPTILRPGIDRRMDVEYTFEDGRLGRTVCSLWSMRLLAVHARVIGSEGSLFAMNPIAPQLPHWLTIRTKAGTRRERFEKTASYTHQLRAFAKAVRMNAPVPTDVDDAVANMRVIDAIYRAAGMEPRRGTLA